jgi:uncharacterized protein YbaR (Trm112 family)
MADLILSPEITIEHFVSEGIVVCPQCHNPLVLDASDAITCGSCAIRYPLINGTPILTHRESAFMADDASCLGNVFANSISENRFKRRLRRSLPALANEYTRTEVDDLVSRELSVRAQPLSGLVVGAGERPTDMERRFPNVRWLTTDVDMAYRPLLIADTLKLPIADASQDLVVAEMVLEHVMDISQAARELERVCKPGGLVLVKTPFCFPWHGVPTDFFRCTPSGIRVLFRSMETVYLEKCMGPWGALAYQLDTLTVNLTSIRYIRLASAFASRFMFGWLKWLDWLSSSRKRDLITSSGVTFVGRKVKRIFTAREILEELQQQYGSGAV